MCLEMEILAVVEDSEVGLIRSFLPRNGEVGLLELWWGGWSLVSPTPTPTPRADTVAAMAGEKRDFWILYVFWERDEK